MVDLEREAERALDRPLTTSLIEAFEMGAIFILDGIKDEFNSFREDILFEIDDEELKNMIEVSLIDFKEKLDEYV